jgi:hypothetical protein
VDASGKLGATDFKDVSRFKTALLQNHDHFARCIVEKLHVHALGRELEVTDRPAIRHILETATPNGYRQRDLSRPRQRHLITIRPSKHTLAMAEADALGMLVRGHRHIDPGFL